MARVVPAQERAETGRRAMILMKTLALALVVVVALSGVVLETAQGPPQPGRRIPSRAADPVSRDFDFLDALTRILRSSDRELLAILLRSETPAYLDSQEDHGIMTRDWHSACTLCEGWGIQNRHRGDRAVFCESCNRTGLRASYRPVPAGSSTKTGVSRVVER